MDGKLPHSLHFVGVGGIGMSGLAQLACALGRHVSGSDRALDKPENAVLFQTLRAQGVKLYQQDGSRFAAADSPEMLIYSTAIEEDNPDFAAAHDLPRLHRSRAMARAVAELHCRHTVAVTGTCGKTSVTAWLTEALLHLGEDPGMLAGGLANAVRAPDAAGNFRPGMNKFFVLEADESDKSLLNYGADSALILNLGSDHYPQAETAHVFGSFLSGVREFAVAELAAYLAMTRDGAHWPPDLKLVLFSTESAAPEKLDGHKICRLERFESGPDGAFARFHGASRPIRLPGPGMHQAANALAVYAELLELGFPESRALSALENFHGVWRRFDFAGENRCGVRFFDDYAHNADKIRSCLEAGREIAAGKLIVFFQPHGYGPFGFMREELFRMLERELRPDDIFALLPVYYAGGTSSFSPTSAEAAADYRAHGTHRYEVMSGRTEALALVRAEARKGDVVLVMGARDNSLSAWTVELAQQSNP